MFDIGFGELFLIALVILFVVKPTHLPVLAKLLSRRFTQARQSLDKIKAEFRAEVQDLNQPSTHDKEN